MKHHIKTMISEEDINKRIQELADSITNDFKGEELLLVGLLRGSAIFLADISRKIKANCKVDFMCVSSYGNSMQSSGILNIKKDLDEDIKGKNVLIIEDIIDTGFTLSKIKELLLTREPKTLKICTLLDKPDRRTNEVFVDYVGFTIPDEFVVGYGIDYAEQYRTLPYIAKVIQEKE